MPLTTHRVYRISQNTQTMNVEVGNEEMFSTQQQHQTHTYGFGVALSTYKQKMKNKQRNLSREHQLENGIWTYLIPHPLKFLSANRMRMQWLIRLAKTLSTHYVYPYPCIEHSTLTIYRHNCSIRIHDTKSCTDETSFFKWIFNGPYYSRAARMRFPLFIA